MPPAVEPGFKNNPLRTRLTALRRRLRLVTALRGASWLVTVVVLLTILGEALDWRLHLPGLVRAFFLVGTLGGAGYVAVRYLVRPLAAKADDLTLALRVEEHYPSLNDCLASTVQFLDQSGKGRADKLGSPSLLRESVKRAFAQFKDCDFNKIVDARGLRTSGASALSASVLAVCLVLLFPAAAWTALARLALPFGGEEWARQTQLELSVARPDHPAEGTVQLLPRAKGEPMPALRIAKNEPLEIRGLIRGVLPDKATVSLRFDGGTTEERSCDVLHDKDGTSASLFVRLERGKAQRSFTFRVRANDAVSPWFTVSVVPPPALVPLDGKPSPQIRLQYPAYTELPPQGLPDGAGVIVAVTGTRATLRARANRPLTRAWLQYLPDLEQTDVNGFLGAIATEVPAELDASRQVLQVQFEPRFRGHYALHLEDETHLQSDPNNYEYEVRIEPDPAPVIELERPSATRESLRMLPGGEFVLQAQVRDPVFAIRSVYLEYRCKKGDVPRQVPLYGAAAVQSIKGLALPVSVGLPTLQGRQQLVLVEQRFTLAQFKPLDPQSSGLKVGDVLTIQVCADDFDDVTVPKQPGRSHEVEITIVDKNALDVDLNKEQARIQQELVRLREQERNAIKKVRKAEANLEPNGKLDNDDLDQLSQAEQLQLQIRERVGNAQEGLRAEVARIRETLQNNNLPRSEVHERMEMLARELDRLAREELAQVEPRLTNVQKQQQAPDAAQESRRSQELLQQAIQHQQEVERTLDQLLPRLERFTSTLETQGAAKSLLQDQRDLNRETNDRKNVGRGEDPEKLTPQQKQALDTLKNEQLKLQERMERLVDRMERLSTDREQTDSETAKTMKSALEQAKQGNISGQMKDARDQIQQNQLEAASNTQQKAIDELEKLVKTMEERRERELTRLQKKLQEAEAELERLGKDQAELRKKMKEAGEEADPQRRADALKKLAGQQRELQQRTQDLRKKLSELARLRTDQAGEDLGQAADRMEKALKRLESGKMPEEQEEDPLERINEAKAEVSRARADAEEELAREQLAKVADVLRRLKDRQEALTIEGERIQAEVTQNKGWTRALDGALKDLAESEKGLGEETASLADTKLSAAVVFAKMLHRAAAAMDQASTRFEDQRKRRFEKPEQPEITLDAQATRAQREAQRRLQQLLDAAKPEDGVPLRKPPQQNGQPGGEGGGEPGGAQPMSRPSDGIPELAQLKLLRALQGEVNEQTAAFKKQHPDATRLTAEEKVELQAIRLTQQEVADLLEEVTRPANPEGDKP